MEQLCNVAILQIWDGRELVGVVVEGPFGFRKLCSSLEEGFEFLASEFKSIQINDEITKNLRFTNSTSEGFAIDISSSSSGFLIAAQLRNGLEYLGFDNENRLIIRSHEEKMATQVVTRKAPGPGALKL